jgi:hypothetical protein
VPAGWRPAGGGRGRLTAWRGRRRRLSDGPGADAMPPEPGMTWHDFRQAADARLRRGSKPEGSGWTRILRVLELPPFADHDCWELFVRESSQKRLRGLVVHTSWNASGDRAYFDMPAARLPDPDDSDPAFDACDDDSMPEPTIEVRQADLDSRWLRSVMRRLQSLQVATPEKVDRLVADGTGYELRIDGSNRSRGLRERRARGGFRSVEGRTHVRFTGRCPVQPRRLRGRSERRLRGGAFPADRRRPASRTLPPSRPALNEDRRRR